MAHSGIIPAASGVLCRSFIQQSPGPTIQIDINIGIQSFPVELMCKIFTHCLPHNQLPGPEQTEVPVVLLYVCRLWRTIALAIPQIWSGLYLTNDQFINHGSKALELWLNRSFPLPFSFRMVCDDPETFDDEVINATDILCAQAHRLQEVTMVTASLFRFHPSIYNITSLLYDTPSPTLEIFRIRYFSEKNPMIWQPPTSQHIDIQQSACILPRTRFLDLGIFISLDYLLIVLRNMPCLEHLKLHVWMDRHLEDESVHVDLPFLTDFTAICGTASFNFNFNFWSILDHLFLPSLRYLRLEPNRYNPINLRHLAGLFERSRPPLYYLYLDQIPAALAEVVQCLRHIPDLRILHINWSSDSDDQRNFINALMPSNSTNLQDVHVCLNLEELTIKNATHLLEDEFSAMLRARFHDDHMADAVRSDRFLPGSGKLRKVHFQNLRAVMSYDWTVFDDYRAKGFDLQFIRADDDIPTTLHDNHV